MELLARRLDYVRRNLRTIHPRVIALRRTCGLIPDDAFGEVRAGMYRLAGFDVGKHCNFATWIEIWGSKSPHLQLKIGNFVFINRHVKIDTGARVEIEDNVSIGPGVSLLTTSHLSSSERRAGPHFCAPIKIGKGAWIGTNAVILPGAVIPPFGLVPANALWTKTGLTDGVRAATRSPATLE